MDRREKCNGHCVPCMDKPKNLQDFICYAVECINCGCHIIFWKPQRLNKPILTDFIMLGEQKPLNLPLRIDPSFLQSIKELSGKFVIPPLPDFTKTSGLTPDREREVLYEMVACGDIDIDMFNKLMMKI